MFLMRLNSQLSQWVFILARISLPVLIFKLGHILKNDVILAGGLLPSHKTLYFRVGHMGSVNNNDIIAVIAAIESALYSSEFDFEMGIGLKTALKIFNY